MTKRIDLVLKPSGRIISLFGCNHTGSTGNWRSESIHLYTSLLDVAPSAFLTETTRKSLDLSFFVWKTRKSSMTHELFCEAESEFVETPAIAAADKLGLDLDSVVPIDVDSFKTRKKLALKMLLHPIESMMLISRYHGHAASEDIHEWRKKFRESCPTAFSILFTDRELYMRTEILKYLKAGPSGNVAVIVGLSHLDALYDSLLEP